MSYYGFFYVIGNLVFYSFTCAAHLKVRRSQSFFVAMVAAMVAGVMFPCCPLVRASVLPIHSHRLTDEGIQWHSHCIFRT